MVKDCDKKTTEISDISNWHYNNYNIPFDSNDGLINRYKAELKAELNDIGDLEIVVRDEKGQIASNNIKNIKSYGAFASSEAKYSTQDYKDGRSNNNSKRSPKSEFTFISCDELGDKNGLLNKTTGLKNTNKSISGCSIS